MFKWLRRRIKPKVFEGKHIREVWDFRLSVACPFLYNSGDTWVVKIVSNSDGSILEEYDTQVPATDDVHDVRGIKACYKWLYTVRDKYARPHIEERKPVVKLINEANRRMNHAMSEATYKEMDFPRESRQIRADAFARLERDNIEIAKAVTEMHKKIKDS